MRFIKTKAIASASAALLLCAARAGAQVDVNPPLPNVLLLVDTSGSMEYKIDGTKVTCDHVDPTLANDPVGTSEKSRWTQLVEVMTGDIQNYACYTQDRKTVTFRDEYKLGTSMAPDYNYQVPYHRILSNGCAIGAGVADANPFAWGTTPFKFHPWNNVAGNCAGVTRAQTGLLDSYRDRVRFGLMTFDTQTDAGTGITPGKVADYASGTRGTWSYFLDYVSNPDCNSNTGCARGKPAECPDAPAALEVGARNAAAPPWEGRLVPFGSPTATIADVHMSTDRIKDELLAVRPFGATPINGMLADAQTFLTLDSSGDPIAGGTCDTTTGENCFGPRYDPYITSSIHCRKSFVILLTDGEPNLDLRPYCEGVTPPNPGQCPYAKKPEEIVADLANNAVAPIQTFVIGFALSSITAAGLGTIDCSTISQAQNGLNQAVFDPNGYCAPGSMKPELKTCCTLAKIAFNGGTTNAHFATNVQELRTALSSILDSIAHNSTTRTLPVFSSNTSASGGAFTFFATFNVASGQMWRGELQRKRTICAKVPGPNGSVTFEPQDQPITDAAGDDFAYNVNTAASDALHPRHYYTVLADPDPSLSAGSVRPKLASDDGAGLMAALAKDGDDASFPDAVPGAAMNVSTASCPAAMNATSANNCAAHYMKWEIGATDGVLPNRVGNVLADIYHGTPVVVGPPGANLLDESYLKFTDAWKGRPIVLYAPTNDGQLHAFKVAPAPGDLADPFKVDTWPAQNELWSFFPPAVLHRIPSQYPSTHQSLLDGPPMVADVVFARDAGSAESGGAAADWHTVLVAGFGAAGGGYYALDITNPTGGAKMLWQLTTDAAGNRLFGERSGVPTIATLYFDPTVGGTNPKQYAVAILPGGQSAGPTTANCTVNDTFLPDGYKARPNVHCWAKDAARSVTVVMLETGQIVRTFRDKDTPTSINGLAQDGSMGYTALAAPMTGQAVVFPAGEGAVSDRAFLGDGDGMLWRMNLASSNPRDWTINLWFDAYTKETAPPPSATAGQPIMTAPVLSVDRLGAVTVAFSTGDQETFTPGNIKNYLWSLREKPDDFHSDVLWYQEYTNGTRVSGPMVLYGSILYFTTLTPIGSNDTNRCSAGSSQLCGENYYLQQTDGNASSGGAWALPDPSDPTQKTLTQCIPLSGIAFGPTISQQPTCSQTDTFSDPYLGWGTHTRMVGGVTGGKSTLTVTVANTTQGAVPVQYELPPPTNTTRIDSWASVIE